MAPHLKPLELDFIHGLAAQGKTPKEIHEKLVARRSRAGLLAPSMCNLRLALKGRSYKRSAVETRGRKQIVGKRGVAAMDKVVEAWSL